MAIGWWFGKFVKFGTIVGLRRMRLKPSCWSPDKSAKATSKRDWLAKFFIFFTCTSEIWVWLWTHLSVGWKEALHEAPLLQKPDWISVKSVITFQFILEQMGDPVKGFWLEFSNFWECKIAVDRIGIWSSLALVSSGQHTCVLTQQVKNFIVGIYQWKTPQWDYRPAGTANNPHERE